jgi:hypothetical protein
VWIKCPEVVEWGKNLRENRAKEILPLTNQLTKQPAVLEKQKVANLVNKFPAVYGTLLELN